MGQNTLKAAPGDLNLSLVNSIGVQALVDMAYVHGFNHLVQKAQSRTMPEIRASRVMMQDFESFMKHPLSAILNPKCAGEVSEKSVQKGEWSIAKYHDKEPIIEEISAVLKGMKLRSILRNDVLLTADELICNALFNAPNLGGINRNDVETSIQLSEAGLARPAQIRLGVFNGFLALACKDNFGTLNPMRVLERMHACAHNGVSESVNFSDAGTTGIGSYMVLNACTSFYMGVKPGSFTQVCALFPINWGTRERVEIPKNLHWVQY
jgi:hypothetical protein